MMPMGKDCVVRVNWIFLLIAITRLCKILRYAWQITSCSIWVAKQWLDLGNKRILNPKLIWLFDSLVQIRVVTVEETEINGEYNRFGKQVGPEHEGHLEPIEPIVTQDIIEAVFIYQVAQVFDFD